MEKRGLDQTSTAKCELAQETAVEGTEGSSDFFHRSLGTDPRGALVLPHTAFYYPHLPNLRLAPTACHGKFHLLPRLDADVGKMVPSWCCLPLWCIGLAGQKEGEKNQHRAVTGQGEVMCEQVSGKLAPQL